MIDNISRQDHLIGIAKASMIGGADSIGEMAASCDAMVPQITSLINRLCLSFN